MENNEPTDINQTILHIVSQYNDNQEDYHRNMRSFLNIMQNMNLTQQPRNDNLYTFEFGLTDAAGALLSLFDPSRNYLSSTSSGLSVSGLSVSGLSPIDISGGTTVSGLSVSGLSVSGLSVSGLSVSGLSPIDISGGTTVSNYTFEDTGLICPITLEYVQVGEPVMRINRCGHRFKEDALRRWFSNHQRCPVCRGNI